MRKHELILSSQNFENMEKQVTEIQRLLEEKKVATKDQALKKLQLFQAEMASYSEKIMNPYAKKISERYLNCLIIQTKKFNP